MTEHAPLSIWTVYNSPRDMPGMYVARRWEGDRPTADVFQAKTLQAVRDLLPPSMHRMPAQPGDDPVIVETWF